MDESDSMTHALLGSVYLVMRRYEKAIVAGERSVELGPNGAMAHGLLGNTLGYAGRLDEAIAYLKQGIRLNPFPPYWYFMQLGRRYDKTAQARDTASVLPPPISNCRLIPISSQIRFTNVARSTCFHLHAVWISVS